MRKVLLGPSKHMKYISVSLLNSWFWMKLLILDTSYAFQLTLYSMRTSDVTNTLGPPTNSDKVGAHLNVPSKLYSKFISWKSLRGPFRIPKVREPSVVVIPTCVGYAIDGYHGLSQESRKSMLLRIHIMCCISVVKMTHIQPLNCRKRPLLYKVAGKTSRFSLKIKR